MIISKLNHVLMIFVMIFGFQESSFAIELSFPELDNYLKTNTLVIMQGETIKLSQERGIKPLICAIGNGDLKDAYLADRIAGKAAALLYVYGGVKKVYAQTMSVDAKKVLKKNKIKFKTRKTVKVIKNRTNTGICPMDAKVKNIDNPQDAWKILNY